MTRKTKEWSTWGGGASINEKASQYNKWLGPLYFLEIKNRKFILLWSRSLPFPTTSPMKNALSWTARYSKHKKVKSPTQGPSIRWYSTQNKSTKAHFKEKIKNKEKEKNT